MSWKVRFGKSVFSRAQILVQGSLIPFVLSLLQPEVVEKLVALREGIPRKDAKEVCSSDESYFYFLL